MICLWSGARAAGGSHLLHALSKEDGWPAQAVHLGPATQPGMVLVTTSRYDTFLEAKQAKSLSSWCIMPWRSQSCRSVNPNLDRCCVPKRHSLLGRKATGCPCAGVVADRLVLQPFVTPIRWHISQCFQPLSLSASEATFSSGWAGVGWNVRVLVWLVCIGCWVGLVACCLGLFVVFRCWLVGWSVCYLFLVAVGQLVVAIACSLHVVTVVLAIGWLLPLFLAVFGRSLMISTM